MNFIAELLLNLPLFRITPILKMLTKPFKNRRGRDIWIKGGGDDLLHPLGLRNLVPLLDHQGTSRLLPCVARPVQTFYLEYSAIIKTIR